MHAEYLYVCKYTYILQNATGWADTIYQNSLEYLCKNHEEFVIGDEKEHDVKIPVIPPLCSRYAFVE